VFVRVTIPITITMVLEDVSLVDDAREQVAEICFMDPTIVRNAILETQGDIELTLE